MPSVAPEMDLRVTTWPAIEMPPPRDFFQLAVVVGQAGHVKKLIRHRLCSKKIVDL